MVVVTSFFLSVSFFYNVKGAVLFVMIYSGNVVVLSAFVYVLL